MCCRYGYRFELVEWSYVFDAVLSVLPLVPVLVVDVLVSFAATRTAGKYTADYDEDTTVTGALFFGQGLLCCPLSTNSTKVSLLNFAIAGPGTRVPTLIVGCTSLLMFLCPPFFTWYVPRFYLSFLLLFTALGFLHKNLVDSYWKLTRLEYTPKSLRKTCRFGGVH